MSDAYAEIQDPRSPAKQRLLEFLDEVTADLSDEIEKKIDVGVGRDPGHLTAAINRFVDAKIANALLDAREAKAEPDPRDARVAELERERDEAQASLNDTIQRMQDLCERHGCPGGVNRFTFIDARLTSAKKAEAALAELRGRVEKAVNHIQRTADRIANRDDMPYGDQDFRELRGAVRAAVILLTEPEAKGGDPAPVLATTEKTDD